MIVYVGPTPEELEYMKKQEEEAKLKKEAEEKAEKERKDAEEQAERKKRQEEWVRAIVNTVNIWTLKKLAVIILKFEQGDFTIESCIQKRIE